MRAQVGSPAPLGDGNGAQAEAIASEVASRRGEVAEKQSHGDNTVDEALHHAGRLRGELPDTEGYVHDKVKGYFEKNPSPK